MRPYEFFRSGNKVIAISSFAQKRVRGIAKCDPEDEFSMEKGKELAEARCAKKIATKRVKCAASKFERAQAAYNEAKAQLDFMTEYYENAKSEYDGAEKKLEEILSKF